MKAALRTPQTRTKNTCQHLTNMDIRTVDTSDYEVLDSEKIEQLRYVLQQLRLSSVKILYLTLGNSHAIHTADSANLSSSLIKAFKQCQFQKLENLRFDIRDMKMNGRPIGIDLCVSSEQCSQRIPCTQISFPLVPTAGCLVERLPQLLSLFVAQGHLCRSLCQRSAWRFLQTLVDRADQRRRR